MCWYREELEDLEANRLGQGKYNLSEGSLRKEPYRLFSTLHYKLLKLVLDKWTN